MPDYFINACSLCSVCNSDIRVVRNKHNTPSGEPNETGPVSYPDIPYSTEATFLRNTCRMPNKDNTSTSICASEFRYASMLTLDIIGTNTTFNSYKNCTDGKIKVTAQSDTFNDKIGTGNKVFGYSKDNGANFCVKTNTNTHTFSNLGVGSYKILVTDVVTTDTGRATTQAGKIVRVRNGTSKTRDDFKNVQQCLSL